MPARNETEHARALANKHFADTYKNIAGGGGGNATQTNTAKHRESVTVTRSMPPLSALSYRCAVAMQKRFQMRYGGARDKVAEWQRL